MQEITSVTKDNLSIPVKSSAPQARTRLRDLRENKEFKRFIKYGLVGTLGAVVDFTVLNFLIFVVGWNGEWERVLANTISVSAAIISNFTWNRLWTFPESKNRNKRTQFIQFVVVSITGLTLNSVIFYLADNFVYAHFLPDILAVQLAKLTAIGVGLFWNFGFNRLWTYRGL